ncbi:hypothetical protein B0J12DRAFT_576288 [Macrophomina phaseolina]|uniref:PAC domain-containing protein n=1 Tax=Macrophomina phaseolina TaxID=35725 RepID=A0ABQ8G9T2_9PEZI|nr:hypothetical protein B0J12DRAFT_576288 [Macrophomina phaseolina]
MHEAPELDRVSSSLSADGPSVFDNTEGRENGEPTQSTASSPGALSGYDLMPPPPNITLANAERLADRLFSADHLNLILRHQPAFARFTAFLNQYRPRSAPTLVRYLETRKAMAAIDYANAIAVEMTAPNKRSSSSGLAAHLSSGFEARSRRAVEELITDALPAYITHRLTQIVTELLIKEITGSSAPMNRHLAEGLAEVYCLTDPSLPDNPIVYASEEFHLATQYGRDYVIGRNCRFLQGPKTAPDSVRRIREAIRSGQEICETLLNYRRDGSPFINLCLVAPLYDNKGNVRYFIGCQIDVTNLIEGGKGLESFQLLLDQDLGAYEQGDNPQKSSLKAIGHLAELISTEEVDVLKHKGRNPSASRSSTPAPPPPSTHGSTPNRRLVGVEDPLEINVWPPTQFGPHGRLPGVYQSFMLVRPWPSLRIIFTSAALRIPGLAQSRLLDRIGGPQSVREGIATAFAEGVRVTAKISWLTGNPHSKERESYDPPRSNSIEGKPRYIHCTPLHGSDGQPGVWMVVMVENEGYTGAINARRKRWGYSPVGPGNGVMSSKFTQEKLFNQYQVREGGDGRSSSRSRAQSNTQSRYVADDNASTFFVDEEPLHVPVSSIYAEYLANGDKRSASASRGPSRPPSRAASARGNTSSPETKKRWPRDEVAKIVRLPVPPERMGGMDEE